MKIKKLVCDRCGAEITDEHSIDVALEGQEAWEATVRAQGAEPRGILPCENFIRCGGEMKPVENHSEIPGRRGWRNLFSQ